MRVQREKVVLTFQKLGMKGADRWEDPLLKKKVSDMPKYASGEEDLEDPELQAMLEDILASCEKGEEIEIDTEAPSGEVQAQVQKVPSQPKRRGRPAKTTSSVEKSEPKKRTKRSEGPSSDAGSRKRSPRKDGEPSTKQKVYSAWKQSGETLSPAELQSTYPQVQLTTVRSWLGGWKNKKNLPAGVS